MKTFVGIASAAAAAGAVFAIAPAGIASADPPPPLAEGAYTETVTGQAPKPVLIRYDCGPTCFTLDDLTQPDTGKQYQLDPASGQWRGGDFWLDSGGVMHKDGIDLTATFVPA